MNIELLHYTPIWVLELAAAEPYQSKPTEKLVERVWGSGHRSIARHSIAVFKVTDISQNLLRQISRHPHVNLTVKSSRYNDMTETPVVYPPFLKPEHYNEFNDDYLMSKVIYKSWINKPGYTKEQGRELAKLHLVLGSTTTLIISGNYQALYEYLQLRLCNRAEWEIRDLAERIRDRLTSAAPAMFADLGCKGDEFGFCPEVDGGCGKYPRKEISGIRRIL